MNTKIEHYISPELPFCIFQKDQQVTIATGELQHVNNLDEIPAYRGPESLHAPPHGESSRQSETKHGSRSNCSALIETTDRSIHSNQMCVF